MITTTSNSVRKLNRHRPEYALLGSSLPVILNS
jgi:hypothetical protein